MPWAVAAPVLAAFLIEFVFYLAPGFEAARVRLTERFSRAQLAPMLAASALAPYLIYALGTGAFHWPMFLLLGGIALFASFWFVVFPGTMGADLGYIAVLAAIYMAGAMKRIYVQPFPKLQVDVLGHLMLIRLGASAMLLQRHYRGTSYGFLPTRSDWFVGARFFLYFLPIAVPLGWALGVVRFHWPGKPAWQAVGIFFGILWVVALSEEFVFRGVLQQWMTRATGSAWAGLAIASVCFGLCHLPMRGFPNWRFAAFNTVAGAFWGLAYAEGRSIRASMVSHALVVTAWMMWMS